MWVVCENKDDNSRFITTRTSRETMISVLHGLGQIVDSRVLKEFKRYDDAQKYMKAINDADKLIDNNLK